jgi:hypothetical protein
LRFGSAPGGAACWLRGYPAWVTARAAYQPAAYHRENEQPCSLLNCTFHGSVSVAESPRRTVWPFGDRANRWPLTKGNRNDRQAEDRDDCFLGRRRIAGAGTVFAGESPLAPTTSPAPYVAGTVAPIASAPALAALATPNSFFAAAAAAAAAAASPVEAFGSGGSVALGSGGSGPSCSPSGYPAAAGSGNAAIFAPHHQATADELVGCAGRGEPSG